jgi:hypothetical protein
MQPGLTLTELAQKIQSQAALKKDFIAPTKRTWLDVEDKEMRLVLENQGEFPLQPLAHRQLATWSDIPQRYYDRMRDEVPQLLANNVTEWLRRSDKSRMIRTLAGEARAYLSNSYARVDYVDVAEAALPVLYEIPGVQVVSSNITDSRLYIQAVVPTIQGQVKVGDIVQAGVIISDSEVGLGSVSVSNILRRLICLNGMKTADVFRKTHVGRQVESSEILWAEDTQRADDKAVLLKVRDMVRAAVDQHRFQQNLEKLQGLTDGRTKSPVAAVEVLSNKFGLTDTEKGSVLNSLIEGGDLSRWGLLNAITAQAHTAPSYDRAIEFEAMGGQLIELKKDEWNEVLEAA